MVNETTPLIIIILAGILLGVFFGIVGAKIAGSISRIVKARKSKKVFLKGNQRLNTGGRLYSIERYGNIEDKGFIDIKAQILEQQGSPDALPKGKKEIKTPGLLGLFKKKEEIKEYGKHKQRNKKVRRLRKRHARRMAL